MVVAYDHKRGEERAKFKKTEDRKSLGKGDCIDCHQCVHVCPTGIDIRNGTQLECVNCTACIDACDTIMEGVGQEKGLIRFVSENGIKNGTRFQWTNRVKAYTALLIILTAAFVVLLVSRSAIDATILRQRGSTYQMSDDGMVTNIFELDLTNKTKKAYQIYLEMDNPKGKIELVVDSLVLPKEKFLKERFIVKLPLTELKSGKAVIKVRVIGNGSEITSTKAKFIGPLY